MARMTGARWGLAGVVAGALFALGGYRVAAPADLRCVAVRRGTSVSAVYATGVVEPVDRVDLAARISGPIEAILVREGDAVKKGDVVARIEAQVLDADAARARAESTAAAQRLSTGHGVASLQAQRRALEVQLVQARRELSRVQALAAAKAVSPADLDRARAQVDALSAQISANHAQARDMSIGLRADADRQKAMLDASMSRVNDAELRSPLDGTVLVRRAEVGQVVTVNQVLVRVGDLTHLHIEADIDETDIGLVRAGMEAGVRLYADRANVIPARVSKVHPEANRDRKAFRIDVEIESKDIRLLPGMTAEVNVIAARHDGVLLAPRESIRDGTVRVVTADGRVETRPARVVQHDLAWAEVEGLDEGAQVIVDELASTVKDGARARARLVEGPAEGR